jgi:hypothetical protein
MHSADFWAERRIQIKPVMKKILNFTCIFAVLAIGYLIPACQTISENNSEIATSGKEMLLTDAGFRARTITTSKMQQQVTALASNKVSAVKHNGKLYYVYPTTRKDQILVGNQAQFEAYRASLQSQRASQPSQMHSGDPVWVEETAGPGNVSIETFEGLDEVNP